MNFDNDNRDFREIRLYLIKFSSIKLYIRDVVENHNQIETI